MVAFFGVDSGGDNNTYRIHHERRHGHITRGVCGVGVVNSQPHQRFIGQHLVTLPRFGVLDRVCL
jgi:hypothetical protein